MQNIIVALFVVAASPLLAQPWVARPEDLTSGALTGYVTYQGEIYKINRREDRPSTYTISMRDRGLATTPTQAELRYVQKLEVNYSQEPGANFTRYGREIRTYPVDSSGLVGQRNGTQTMGSFTTSLTLETVPYE
jgi:hypothetical protein